MKGKFPFFGALILFLLMLVGPALAAETKKQEVPEYAFSKQYPCDILKVDALVGYVALGLGFEGSIDKVMPCLFGLWKGKETYYGEGAYVLSNAFLSIMELNPEVLLSWMNKEPEIFSLWTSELPNLSFTWSHKPPCYSETYRKRLILILKSTEMVEPPIDMLKNKMMKRLTEIRCRQID